MVYFCQINLLFHTNAGSSNEASFNAGIPTDALAIVLPPPAAAWLQADVSMRASDRAQEEVTAVLKEPHVWAVQTLQIRVKRGLRNGFDKVLRIDPRPYIGRRDMYGGVVLDEITEESDGTELNYQDFGQNLYES